MLTDKQKYDAWDRLRRILVSHFTCEPADIVDWFAHGADFQGFMENILLTDPRVFAREMARQAKEDRN